MNPRKIAIFLGLFVCFSVTGCATYQVHPEFKERQKSLKTLACLPPDVEVYRVTFAGEQEQMHELYPLVQKYTVDALQEVLKNKGYQIQPMDLSESTLAQQPELRTTLHSVQELYKKALEDIAKHRQKKFTYTVGSEINPLADWAHADALLVVKWVAYKKTGGEIAKDIAKSLLIGLATFGNYVPVFSFSEGLIYVAVVDGNTGDILWYHNNLGRTAVNVAEEDQVKKMVKQVIAPFTKSAALTEEKKAKSEKKKTAAPTEEVSKKNAPIISPPASPLGR